MYLIGVKERWKDCEVSGVDFSTNAVRKALRYTNKVESNLAVANAPSLPFKDNAFDLVLCSETLEHIVNDKLAIKELARISRKTCVITVPSFNNQRAKNRFKPDLECKRDTHLRKYLKTDLEELLSQYFKNVTIFNLSFWYFSSMAILVNMYFPKISLHFSHFLSNFANLDYCLSKAGAHGHSFMCICKKVVPS